MYALPGSDINLTCQTKEKNFLVQMQWSKVTDKNDMIALYHPQYGLYCGQEHACESQVAATETEKGVTNWTLYLRNISSALGGKYECIFTLYPEGIKTTVYNLIVEPCEYKLPTERFLCFHEPFIHLVNTRRQQTLSTFGIEHTKT